jgi:hypothetical protein
MKPITKKIATAFTLIAIGLAITGLITNNFLWYIRAGIFLIASLFLILKNKILK